MFVFSRLFLLCVFVALGVLCFECCAASSTLVGAQFLSLSLSLSLRGKGLRTGRYGDGRNFFLVVLDGKGAVEEE